jgi:alpha-glucosidase
MQWDSSNPQAGFSANAKTWLPVPTLYREVNVRQQEADPTSLLNWYKRLIALRRNEDALRDGGMVMLNDDDPNVLSWLRNSAAGAPVVIAVNMSATAQTVRLRLDAAGLHANTARTLAADSGAPEGLQKLDALTLPPFSSWIGELVNARGSSAAAQAPPAQHRSRSSAASAQSVHLQQR